MTVINRKGWGSVSLCTAPRTEGERNRTETYPYILLIEALPTFLDPLFHQPTLADRSQLLMSPLPWLGFDFQLFIIERQEWRESRG
jgi:hypothetical protein